MVTHSCIWTKRITKNSVEQLAKHPYYPYIWIGLNNGQQLDITHYSDKQHNILEQHHYSIIEPTQNQQIAAALRAIIHNHTVIERYKPLLEEQYKTVSENDLHWFLAIPLQCTEAKQAFGVLAIYSNRVTGFETEEINLLERLAIDISLIVHSHNQKAILQQMENNRIANYEETILAFVNIIEQRDTYTAGHTIRVAEYCKKIATALNIEAEDIKKLEKAAILHDIGKVATPDAVLLKPGKLSALEYELIKQHAYAGYDMLSKIDMYKDLAEIIRYHHARYDGKGYPETGHPDEIPFLAHIMAVADAFDAMISNRIYKPRRSVAEALTEIHQYAGAQFHPKVVAAALTVLNDTKITHTSQTPSNELEKKRFSYFFCDALTELYNENYLHIVLTNTEREQLFAVLCLLKDFSQYNKKYGWNAGNQLLIEFAKQLKNQFPQATLFRYHGDDFILLFESEPICHEDDFDNIPILKENDIRTLIRQFSL